MVEWARGEPSVDGLILIGSRARAPEDTVWRADRQSDWDFQIIAKRPDLFFRREWADSLGPGLRVYTVRRAAIGGVPKVSALFDGAEADFIVLPFDLLDEMRQKVAGGEHHSSPGVVRTLQDLAVVIRPGWRFLKGRAEWEPFYETVVRDVPDPRLSDAQVIDLADVFVCDFVWACRKAERGEWVAAQRMLHRSLAETNLQLLHELRLRRNERTFPEGRRAEMILPGGELQLLQVEAKLEAASLEHALERAATTCRTLVAALVKEAWRWPDLRGPAE